MSLEFNIKFRHALFSGFAAVWSVFASLLCMMAALGLAVAAIEGWPPGDGLYFAFVSGLTIGYGDLVPKATLARVLAILIGFLGILLGGLVAAVGVHAVTTALSESRHH